MKHFLDESLLITDVRAFRGMECEYLMVVLDSKESALYQNVVQAFARCTKDLTIVMATKTLENRTLGVTVKEWEKKQIVKAETFDAELVVNSNEVRYREIPRNIKSFDFKNDESDEAYQQSRIKINRFDSNSSFKTSMKNVSIFLYVCKCIHVFM